jgi:hypothetical protein
MFINERDNAASFDLIVSTGEYYGLTATDLKQVVKETVAGVAGWRTDAAKTGISRSEIDRMTGAFENEAHDAARAFVK